MTQDESLQIIFEAVEEYNQQVADDQHLESAAQTILFGRGGKLDSMGLVNLIILVEEKVNERFGKSVSLADERAVSQENSPFRSVESLADYLVILLKETEHA